jgi:hypothetical protein
MKSVITTGSTGMNRVTNDEIRRELEIHSTEDKMKEQTNRGYNICKEWTSREYENKFSITRQEEEEILAVQGRDGKLIPEQEDFLCLEVKMKKKKNK